VKVRGTRAPATHTTLDGVTIASPETVRQITLDLIPADLSSQLQINKTLQANMEGDGSGGSVDLRTKSAEDRPTIYLESTADICQLSVDVLRTNSIAPWQAISRGK